LAAPVGQRNATLNRCAFRLAQAAAGGLLDGEEAKARLRAAALNIGLESGEANATIASGWAAGSASPRGPEPRHGTNGTGHGAAGGALDGAEARGRPKSLGGGKTFQPTAGNIGLEPGEVNATLANGWTAGSASPRGPEPRHGMNGTGHGAAGGKEAPPEGPQPLLREIPPGAPYPVEALGALRLAVEAVQGAVQAPVAIPAASALAVASLAVQGFADVEILGGPRPTSLFLLTVARSGERKSSCDAALLAALRDFEKEQAKEHRTAFAAWQNAHAQWAGERRRSLNEAKAGKGERRTAAEADSEAVAPEPAAPPLPDRTVSEPTFEGLTRLFAHGMPSLGLFSDEGGQFLNGFSMSADHRPRTLAALNDLWQANAIRRTRAGDGHMVLHNLRLAMHLMTQPVVAHALLADPLAEGTGFLARCLIAEPQSTIGTRRAANARPNPAALAAFGGAASRNPRNAHAHGLGNPRTAPATAASFG
jgi:hypothetical protein